MEVETEVAATGVGSFAQEEEEADEGGDGRWRRGGVNIGTLFRLDRWEGKGRWEVDEDLPSEVDVGCCDDMRLPGQPKLSNQI